MTQPTATPATTTSATPGATPGVTPLPTGIPSADWTAVQLQPLARVATFEATRAVASGVLPDTAFRLATLDGSDPVAAARRVTVEPALRLEVDRADETVAILRPAAPLRQGQAYRVSLRTPDGLVTGSWAVEAVGPLHVVTNVPGDQTTDVPRDSGIEVTFDQDGIVLAEAKPFIAIEPAVAGRFIQEGRTIAFAPDRPLAASTLYRVIVRHGLPLHGTAMTLEHDVTFAFETTGGPAIPIRVTFDAALFDASTREQPALSVRVDRDEETTGSPKHVGVTAHRLPGIDAAVRAWALLRDAPDWTTRSGTSPVDTVGLTRVFSGSVALRRFDPENDWESWFAVPRRLSAGWYVVTMTYDDVPRQAILQVTDLAAYAVVSETRTLVWVNDLRTKGPVEGATAGLYGTSLGRTAANGVLVARTPAVALDPAEDAGPGVVVIRSGSRTAFVSIGMGGCAKCEARESSSTWWVVLQPDRFRYRSTDTIHVWGVLRDRGTQVPPRSAEVRLLPSDGGDDQPPTATVTVRPDRSGSFLADIPIRDLPYGEYRVVLAAGDKVVSDRWINVGPIAKPAWTMSLATRRHAVLDGTRVHVDATARFFEGTPVVGARIVASSGDNRSTIVSSTTGVAAGSVRVALDDDSPQWSVVGIEARPKQPEEGEILAYAEVAVFRSSVILQLTPSLSVRRLAIGGSLHEVAFSRFERDVVSLDQVDPYGAAVAGSTVRLTIKEHRSVRHQTGTTYDFLLKRVVPVYDYEEVVRVVATRTVRTDAAGRYRLTLDVTGGTDRSYEVVARAADDAARVTSADAWAWLHDPADSADWPSIQPVDDDWPEYSIGDPIRVAFRGAAPAASSRWLWTVSQGGLRTWTLTSRPRLSLPFRASYVPGVAIDAVRWTGVGYEVPMEGYTARYRITDRSVDVAVTADKARYAPGGSATLTVATTRGGRPVDASVFVRVIDEKLYASGFAADEDPLDSLYQLVASGILGVGWTHGDLRRDERGWGDTTGGGEGGDTYSERSDFRDWLVARIVRTGGDGRASLTVDLSDDLTSWRAAASAVTTDLRAGIGTALLPVGLPFFAELTVAPEYLAVDRPVVSVRGHGTGLGAADTVTFRVSSETLPMPAVTVTGPAFQPVEVPLPALTVGTHRLHVEAWTGTGTARRRDALVRTFEVVATRLTQASTTIAPLTGATGVPAGDGMTALVLSDAGRGRVVPILEELARSDALRADRAIAAGIAARTLRDAFGIDDPDLAANPAVVMDLEQFQQGGGIAVLPYAASDPELTALVALAGDPRIDAGGIRGWIDEQAPETREQRLWVLLAKAASGEAVVAAIRAAADLPDLTVREQVVVALAAMAAGDDDTAIRLERAVLGAHGQRLGPWVRVSDASANTSVLLTARLAIVAAALGDPVAADMDAYVAANPSTATALELERALAARGWAGRIPAADATAFVTVDGVRREVAIRSGEPARITLTPVQAASARLEPGAGSVVVSTTLRRPLETARIHPPAGQTLTRKMKPGGTIDATDVVVVEFRVAVGGLGTEGCWVLTDMAPSGLRPIENRGELYDEDTETSVATLPMSVVGQRVDFCVERDPDRPEAVLRYAARVITPGSYRWEATLLQSPLIPDQGSVIEASTLVIRPLGEVR